MKPEQLEIEAGKKPRRSGAELKRLAGIIRDRLTCLPARGGSAALTVGGGLLVDDWLSAGRRAVSAVPATTSVRFTAGHIGRAPLVATKEH